MNEATITVTTATGQPLDACPDDHPFIVEVHIPRPEDGDPPETIDITIESEEDEETLTLAWTGNLRGPVVYRSNAITMDDGAAGGGTFTVAGFEFSTGEMGPVDTSDGEEVNISYEGESTTITIYDSWHTLAMANLHRFFNIAEAYWSELKRNLTGEDDPDAAQLIALADLKLGLIARGRGYLENEKFWDSERVAVGQLYAGYVRGAGLDHDQRTEFELVQGTKQNARDRSMEVIWRELTNIVLGFYVLFTNATSAAQLYTLFTGRDVFDEKVSFGDRVLAAIDLAANAAGEAAGIAGAYQRVRRRSESVGLTPVARGVDPENVDFGVVVDPWDFGVLRHGTRHARYVADRFGVIIEIRPANLDSMRWQGMGHPRKPEAIKQKTINELDVHLGADRDHIGLVGHFQPKKPTRTAGMDDATWAALQKRYKSRLEAWDTYNPKMQKMADEGKVKLEDGVVIDTGLCGNTGKAITGDYDIWAVRDKKTGRLMDAEEAQPVVDALRGGGFDAKHGAHRNWNPTDEAGIAVDEAIQKRHQQRTSDNPEGGNESILVVGGRADGPARTRFSDSPDIIPGVEPGPSGTRTAETVADGRTRSTEVQQGARAGVAGLTQDSKVESAERGGLTAEEKAAAQDRLLEELSGGIYGEDEVEPEEWSPGDEDEVVEVIPDSSGMTAEEKAAAQDRLLEQLDGGIYGEDEVEPEEWSPEDEEEVVEGVPDNSGMTAEEKAAAHDRLLEQLDGGIYGEEDIEPEEWTPDEEPEPTSVAVGGPSLENLRQRGLLPFLLGGLGLIVVIAVVLSGLLGGQEDQSVTEALSGDAGAQVVQASPPTSTPVATPTLSARGYLQNVPSPMQVTGRRLLEMGVPGADLLALAGFFTEDDPLDWIYSIEDVKAGMQNSLVDIIWSMGGTVYLANGVEDPIFNQSIFECGDGDERLVICPPNVLPMPPGDMVVASLVLAESLPAPSREQDPGGMPVLQAGEFEHTYAFVIDTDGNPANNFIAQSPYNWDYYQGTDTWYEVYGNPTSGTWQAAVTGFNFQVLPSTLRVVMEDDTVTFFISAEELGDLDVMRYRMSAFMHDGSFQPDVSGGDVVGENPTTELLPIIHTDIRIEQIGESGVGESGQNMEENVDEQGVFTPTFEQETTATRGPTPTNTAIPIPDYRSSAEDFIDKLSSAHAMGDVNYLFDRLHEEVLMRYGEDQCRSYLTVVTGTLSQLTVEDVMFPVDFTYATDDLSTLITDALRLEVSYEVQGSLTQGMMHIIFEDEEGFWFTDCGDPLQ